MYFNNSLFIDYMSQEMQLTGRIKKLCKFEDKLKGK